jgi:DNA mismatch repair protein MSH2
LGVKECIMQINEKRKDHELAALYGVVDRCGIVVSEKRAADFTTKDIEGDIKRLLGKDTEAPTLRTLRYFHALISAQFDLHVAMGASAALVKYLGVSHNFPHS